MGAGGSILNTTATDPMIVGGKETLVVEIESGKLSYHGSSKPIEEVEQVLLVLDPRNAENCFGLMQLLTPDILMKTKGFLLLPSISSSPESMAIAEVTLQSMGFIGNFASDVLHVVRVDDWLAYGDTILVAMVEAGKRVYPAEEAGAMLGFFEENEELSAMEEDWENEDENGNPKMKSTGPRSRFAASIFSYRAWCHWPMGFGSEESQIGDSIAAVTAILRDESNSLPRLECCPPPTWPSVKGPLCPTTTKPVFIAFNEASAAKYSAALGVSVLACGDPLIPPDILLTADTFEGKAVEDLDPALVAQLKEGELLWLTIEANARAGLEGWEEEDDEGKEEGPKRAEAIDKTGSMWGVDWGSVATRLNDAKTMMGDTPWPEKLAPALAGKAPSVLIIEPADLACPAEGKAWKQACNAIYILPKLREANPELMLSVVLTAPEFEAHASNRWLLPSLHQFTENCDVCLFAVDAELPALQAFFSGAKYDSENTAKVLALRYHSRAFTSSPSPPPWGRRLTTATSSCHPSPSAMRHQESQRRSMRQ
jgi:hypothetical protein